MRWITVIFTLLLCSSWAVSEEEYDDNSAERLEDNEGEIVEPEHKADDRFDFFGKKAKLKGLFSPVPTYSQGVDFPIVKHSYLKPFIISYPKKTVHLGVKIPVKTHTHHAKIPTIHKPVHLPPLKPGWGPPKCPHPERPALIPSDNIPAGIPIKPIVPLPSPVVPVLPKPILPLPSPVIPVAHRPVIPISPIVPVIPKPALKPLVPVHPAPVVPHVIRPGNSVHTSFFATFPKFPIGQRPLHIAPVAPVAPIAPLPLAPVPFRPVTPLPLAPVPFRPVTPLPLAPVTPLPLVPIPARPLAHIPLQPARPLAHIPLQPARPTFQIPVNFPVGQVPFSDGTLPGAAQDAHIPVQIPQQHHHVPTVHIPQHHHDVPTVHIPQQHHHVPVDDNAWMPMISHNGDSGLFANHHPHVHHEVPKPDFHQVHVHQIPQDQGDILNVHNDQEGYHYSINLNRPFVEGLHSQIEQQFGNHQEQLRHQEEQRQFADEQQYLSDTQQAEADPQHAPQFPQAFPQHHLSGVPVNEAFENLFPRHQNLPLRRPLLDFAK